MLLQVVQNIGVVELVGGGTLGSIATMIVQKLLSRKKDKTDIVTSQVQMLSDVNEKLGKTIDQLQDLVCYVPKCDFRLNGNEKK